MDFGVGFLSNSVMLPFLDFFYGIVPSYGLAIVALTLVVRLALFPVSANQLRSMRRMKIANPIMQQRIKEVQERYKSDPAKQQEEMGKVNSANFKEFGNPLSGCLPAILQLPILFALFATLRGSPFADINYTLNFQISPPEQIVESQPFVSPTQNVYFADKVHYPVQAIAPSGTSLAVGAKETIKLQTIQKESFDVLNAKFPDTDLTPKWQITKGQGLAEVSPDGVITALQPGDVTVQATVPGLASSKGFLFIQALGKVGATNPDGSINWDIMVMILGFGLSLYINQAISGGNSSGQKANSDSQQQQETMNKITPVIFSGMFLFFPLPSGVLLYMLIANVFQTVQAFIVSKEPLPENLQKLVDTSASPAQPTKRAEPNKAIAPSKAEPSKMPFKAKDNKAETKVDAKKVDLKAENKAEGKAPLPFEPGSSKKKKKD
ncbi:membrane protein insertase YidC [Tumidithrix helvetica PCC 7403]|uniref:membrane protein insertase YidC n=1 Tax=Tumidithrix helvetica TaxID=3457545 RepID=UPI003CB3800B